MYVKRFASLPNSDIESYQAPTCFELAGKELTLKMTDGTQVLMSFAAFPCKEVFLNGAARGLDYECMKIGEHVVYITYVLPEVFAAYVLDMEKGNVTRVVTDAENSSVISFGSINDSGALHAFSDDLAGNKVRWILGKQDESAFLAEYLADGMNVTRPYVSSAPALAVTGFRTVKITDSIYLTAAVVETDGAKVNLIMAANFWNITCVGSIFSRTVTEGGRNRLFAGYGRFMNE